MGSSDDPAGKTFKTRSVQTDPVEFEDKNAKNSAADADMDKEYAEYVKLGGSGSWLKMPKMFRKALSYADVIEKKKKS